MCPGLTTIFINELRLPLTTIGKTIRQISAVLTIKDGDKIDLTHMMIHTHPHTHTTLTDVK